MKRSVLLLLAAGCSSGPPSGSGEIAGTVTAAVLQTDSLGAVTDTATSIVSGARLLLYYGSSLEWTGYSGGDGSFRFTTLPAGSFHLSGRAGPVPVSTDILFELQFDGDVLTGLALPFGPYDTLCDEGSTSPPYPVPARTELNVPFRLADRTDVQVDVYSVNGDLIRRFTNAYLDAGSYVALWDMKDENGAAVSSGLYFIRIEMDTSHLYRAVTVG